MSGGYVKYQFKKYLNEPLSACVLMGVLFFNQAI